MEARTKQGLHPAALALSGAVPEWLEFREQHSDVLRTLRHIFHLMTICGYYSSKSKSWLEPFTALRVIEQEHTDIRQVLT